MPFDIGGFIFNGDRIENDARAGIVTDGLVLHLDAGISESYPKSGTTWYDLSSNGNNGTLTNGPTYSSVNGGSITFDGTNDHVNLNNTVSGSHQTIDIWLYSEVDIVNDTTTGAGGPIISDGSAVVVWMGGFTSGISGETFNVYSGSAGRVTAITDTITQGWHNFVLRWNGSYYDIFMESNQKSVVSRSEGHSFLLSNSFDEIGGRDAISQYFIGDISIVRIYNRALSATEITQNFNAQRARFGV